MLGLLAVLGVGLSFARAAPSRTILVLEQSDVRGPFYADIFAATRAALNRDTAGPVTLYVENLDLNRFGGPTYEDSLQRHLQVKYRDRPIGVVMAVGPAALEFAQRWRSTLWPGTPVVFGMVDEQFAVESSALPDTTGQALKLSFSNMVATARAVVPDLKSVVLVGDKFEQQALFRQFRSQIPAATQGLEVVDLTGLPMADIVKRVSALPSDSAILYTAVYSDGAGTYFPPADALAMIAQSANRPIIVAAETFVGPGGTGGYVMAPSAIGMGLAETALRIFHGEKASDIPVAVAANAVRPVFDWRQLQRWSVNLANLPPDSEIRYRPLTAWEQYRWQIVLALVIMIIQGALIVGMLLEHRRRRRAELEARERLSEIAHMNRRATAGELCASITHELNQPLGAILSNTETAEELVRSNTPDLEEVREILADIRRDDLRASEIIQRLRGLLAKASLETEEFDLNKVVCDVFALMAHQAAAYDTGLSTALAAGRLSIRGNRIQLEQVILNLVMNALEAMEGGAKGRREIIGRTTTLYHVTAEISIIDTGPGVDAGKIRSIFKPFYTTKPGGMGMGLSIARKIVEAHGGQIWVENRHQGGAEFRLRFPLVQATTGG